MPPRRWRPRPGTSSVASATRGKPCVVGSRRTPQKENHDFSGGYLQVELLHFQGPQTTNKMRLSSCCPHGTTNPTRKQAAFHHEGSFNSQGLCFVRQPYSAAATWAPGPGNKVLPGRRAPATNFFPGTSSAGSRQASVRVPAS